MYAGHTENRIFGCAVNPYDNSRTCGGSSGGDGGLVGSKCIPFAIGTDIGGSIRSPASCSGVIGFKPTSQRGSYAGMVVPTKSYLMPQSPIMSTAGPICQTVEDVKVYLSAMW